MTVITTAPLRGRSYRLLRLRRGAFAPWKENVDCLHFSVDDNERASVERDVSKGLVDD